ncbi:UTP--glucose-1-phosphate uridylyltransferase [Halalkalibacterium halodurans]|uniref:UTP--glucose-1-phosphate uridylyltransferase n=2 Tax=Halalkalibacterium halodurans TaxID=86665 RepID=Q9KAI4_HALH5|nr:UTP--glucose-1-phosphate uridylyltransferase [Halalkalibacterium halodurans]MDY7222854.1 UTP--glucose-1-phosphate uridylyltransferase [Halalkalibacterium halodurans]MDY7242075.1 UTP--glucose-1-phosphate uridylyltransferase [Halalkalibacterium halodurans]MED4080915.1 UTP--glucose-1-phosphate uridylyltransferase [Halalkalibacterium halodurans]MED4085098.1 UTP--glucose-1-phosphate uridylyltransferase [Halalkalibacterium halodurans]MED4105324.1 UTP--glucose-1-phosphate uridylyltransferase [Hala
MEIKKAIIPAAGYGTRCLPITKVVPKEMFPINGKAALHYIVEEAVAAGIEEIFIILSRNRTLIMDYFDRSIELETFLKKMNKQHLLEKLALPDVTIQFIRQPHANGLGDAIRLGERFVNGEPFAVLLPDDLFISPKHTSVLAELVNVYKQYNKSIIGLQEVESELLKRYGVIAGHPLSSDEYKIENVVEKPQTNPPSNLAIVGRYIFEPAIFQKLKNIGIGKGGEVQLTDAIKALLISHTVIGKIIEGCRYDIGIEEDYQRLIQEFSEKKSST